MALVDVEAGEQHRRLGAGQADDAGGGRQRATPARPSSRITCVATVTSGPVSEASTEQASGLAYGGGRVCPGGAD